MEKLFTEGGRGEHSKEINPESTGYGLSSAKTTVEAHGGSIHAMSEGPGKGSSFVITLPLAQ
jgi:signal transduction histidine kinase